MIGSLLLLMTVVIYWSLCLWHLTLISRWLYIFWSWYLYVDLLWDISIGMSVLSIMIISSSWVVCVTLEVVLATRIPCLGLFLWFDYLCVDCTLSLLHSGSGSLIRWPRGREVVYSYHLGPPQIDRCWMLLYIEVPLPFSLFSWRLLFIWCIYVSCILRSYGILYCILMYLYLF